MKTEENQIHPAVGKNHVYDAKVIANSECEKTGKTITTFALVYPRMVHAELLTHRLFSRNAMSSRAVPVHKMIELVNENPAKPVHWGKNQPGMQANEEHDELVTIDLSWLSEGLKYELTREEAWMEGLNFATAVAKGFSEAGYHKQIVNRKLETYQYIRTIVTSTEWDNWYWLRKHGDAQPEIRHLAELMWGAVCESKPNVLNPHEWHTPFYKNGVWSGFEIRVTEEGEEELFDQYGHTLEQALKISSSCCAQSSFRKEDDSLEKAGRIWDRLVAAIPPHFSPFEHQARPMEKCRGNSIGDEYDFGSTHIDLSGRVWSGNFMGWIQHRQVLHHSVGCSPMTGAPKTGG